MGVCASSGGMFNNYAIVQGVDHVVPVDMYLPGCPPRPEMLIDAILKLHDKVQHTKLGANRLARDRGARGRGPHGAADLADAGAAAMSEEKPTTGEPATAGGAAQDPSTDVLAADAQVDQAVGVRTGMFGVDGSGDTSGYGGLVAPVVMPGAAQRPFGGWFDEVADALEERLRATDLERAVERVVIHRGEITFHVRREDLPFVAQMLRDDERLRFELCCRRQRRALPRRTPAASCTRSTTCSR